MSAEPSSPTAAIPPASAGAFRADAMAGFFVFLIAMPLCLAIAGTSGYPPIAGIWTAVIGGVLCALLSNSQLTIKGPAAGLIVIVLGAVTDLGAEFGADLTPEGQAFLGYKMALGIGVVAGVLQILLGLLKAGRLVDFFPLTPVHGLLASIGLIIIAKQAYAVFGATATKDVGPLVLFKELPGKLGGLNPEITVIGLVSLLILFGLPFVAKRVPALRRVPAQLIVLLVAIGLGSAYMFDLDHAHKYLFPAHMVDGHLENGEYEVGPKFLVAIPNVLNNAADAFAYPDFRGLATGTGLYYLFLFVVIGSLESLLSAKAIELLDPWKRKTNFDRDLLAIGAANMLASAVGGLPMISEIVRSKANIDNGARTRRANMFHGLFLLLFVLLFPSLIHSIPLAALGAMLVYTGFRLASPKEFVRTYKVGSEQFIVFIGTIFVTLATDLLIGIAAGIGLKIVFHLLNGAPLTAFWKADVTVLEEGDTMVVLNVRKAAVFTNWLRLRSIIMAAAPGKDEVVVELSETRLVDHSTMEKLHEMAAEFAAKGVKFHTVGLEEHKPLSRHPLAARKKPSGIRPAVA